MYKSKNLIRPNSGDTGEYLNIQKKGILLYSLKQEIDKCGCGARTLKRVVKLR